MSSHDSSKDFWGVNHWVDPWMKAMDSWTVEAQKLQQTTIDGMTKALDNSHALAKQGLGLAIDMTSTMQKQVKAQFDRTVSFVNSFIQQ